MPTPEKTTPATKKARHAKPLSAAQKKQRRIEVIAAVIITLATIVILNMCSGNFQQPTTIDEISAE